MKIKSKILSLIVIAIAIFGITETVKAGYLTLGSRGGEVSDLQSFLIANGYPIPLIESGKAQKGYFGEQTRTAVRIYQEDKGLATTGSIDSSSYQQSGPVLGSVSGPDFFFDYLNVNGVRRWYYNQTINPAASTTCSFRAPTSASTTLLVASGRLDRIASTSVFEIGYDPVSGFATTTLISRKNVTLATQDALISTSSSALDNLTPARVLAPGSFINFKIGSGAIAGTVTPQGVCKAVLQEI